MPISQAVKQQALRSLEKAHRVRSEGLLERLRIFNGSLVDWYELCQKLKQLPFISFADAEPFDVRSAETLIANADAIVSIASGVPREHIVVHAVYQDDFTLICASYGQAADAPAVAVLISGSTGEATLHVWGGNQSWERAADGGLRLRKNQAAAPESGTSQA